MKNIKLQKSSILAATVVLLVTPVYDGALQADDIEIYTAALNNNSSENISPNILIVLDTSSSMRGSPGFFADAREVWGTYDASITYPGECDVNRIYYDNDPLDREDPSNSDFYKPLRDSSGVPILDSDGEEEAPIEIGCGWSSYFPRAAYVCDYGNLPANGFARVHMQEYRPLITASGKPTAVWDDDAGHDFDGEWHGLTTHHNQTASHWRDPSSLELQANGVGEEVYLWRECREDKGTHGGHDDPVTLLTDESTTEVYPVEDGDTVVSSGSYTGGGSGNDGSDGRISGFSANAAHAEAVSDSNSSWREMILYSGNFLNWYFSAQTRLEIMRGVIRTTLNSTLPGDARVGLIRFDARLVEDTDGDLDNDSSDTEVDPAQGGMVLHEIVKLDEVLASGKTGRQSLLDKLESIEGRSGWGSPLGEATLEALLYYGGREVGFGAKSTVNKEVSSTDAGAIRTHFEDGIYMQPVPTPSTAGSLDPDDNRYYKSPIEHTCQPNHIILLSDGDPSNDAHIKSSKYTGSPWNYSGNYWANLEYGSEYEDEAYCKRPDGSQSDSFCLPALAHYMQNKDVYDGKTGTQSIQLHTIGFGKVLGLSNKEYMRQAALAGAGYFKVADSWENLKNAFQSISRNVVAENTAFAAPALAVNAFNRTRHDNDVYYGLFRTALVQHWDGNLKKFKFQKVDTQDAEGNSIEKLAIVDANDNEAIADSTGFFFDDAKSFWSDEVDGDDPRKGGAAGELDTSRSIYTWLDNTNALSAEPFHETNNNITASMLGINLADPTAAANMRTDVIRWLRGLDVRDEDQPNTEYDDARKRMGDPLHSPPVVVTYGSSESNPDRTVFISTNDGMLHAIDADDGREIFAFVAKESLANATKMYNQTAGKAYGLDGQITVWVDEGNNDVPGVNVDGDTDDKVYLFFGMRRGGRSIYALDVTDRSNPRLAWHIEGGQPGGDFELLGQTWSQPVLGELKLSGTPTKVLAFGGGYDTDHDDPQGDDDGVTLDEPVLADEMGNAVYIVKASTGDRLWWGSSDTDADTHIPEMKNAIPSKVAFADIDRDGWKDRIYVGDMGGRLFRIDVDEVNVSTSYVSATGGMIASLGAAAVSDSAFTTAREDVIANRKFFYPPDVVRVTDGQQQYVALAIGSGNRAHPSYPAGSDDEVRDVFFMIKDTHILDVPDYSSYNIGLSDLYNVKDNDVMSSDAEVRADALADIAAADGWYFDLPNDGEKVLAESTTFDYTVYFTTFQPLPIDFANCETRVGDARLYQIDIRNAAPVNPRFDGTDDSVLEAADRSYKLPHAGIPPAPIMTFTEANDGKPAPLVGTNQPPGDDIDNVFRSYWYIKD